MGPHPWLDRRRGGVAAARAVLSRLIALVVGLAVIACLAVLVSRISWREEIPRSTIAAIAIGLAVLLALWLFGSRGSGTAVGVLAALGAILVAAGASLDWNKILGSGSPPEGALVDCPDLPSDPEFTGVVAPTELGYTHVRLEAGFSEVDARYPPGCELAFDGYCLGDPKDDWRFDTQDPVWFRLHDAARIGRAWLRRVRRCQGRTAQGRACRCRGRTVRGRGGRG